MTAVHTCGKNCCNIKVNNYICDEYRFQKDKRIRKKAGIFIYDPITKKVLIVQSRGRLWGHPKGTVKYGESFIDCAIREVKEETGIDVPENFLDKMVKIKNKAVYYYIEMNECEVKIQDHILDNDVNGIGWINIDCLQEIISNGNINLNKHCKYVFHKFLNKTFQDNNFKTERKRSIKRY